MFGLGMSELIVILIIALIIFGPNKLPEIGKAFGKAIAEFRGYARDPSSNAEKTTQEEKSGKAEA
ncbi:MAG: twin-arginine translocase TatA/TatE family subunit [Synergistaceae bacterium]|nr:twin-arginine translocase TatA/TatE family subunit [Synergistaceae bacterium]MBR1657793.1 twin-arginine translocase TatA/TatE family subunit [Synergistaceae bacterium]